MHFVGKFLEKNMYTLLFPKKKNKNQIKPEKPAKTVAIKLANMA